jgi:hypothetical protein
MRRILTVGSRWYGGWQRWLLRQMCWLIPQIRLMAVPLELTDLPIELDYRAEMILRKAYLLADDWKIKDPEPIRQFMPKQVRLAFMHSPFPADDGHRLLLSCLSCSIRV